MSQRRTQRENKMYFELNEMKTQHIKIHGVQLQQKRDGKFIAPDIYITKTKFSNQ